MSADLQRWPLFSRCCAGAWGIRRFRENVLARFGRVEKRPIIFFGHQKSGTSAIAALFSRACALSFRIDIPVLWGPAAVELIRGKRTFDEVVAKYPGYFSTKVIKEPNFSFFFDQVIGRFPDACFVFIVRDPRQNARSFLERYGIPGDLDNYDPGRLPRKWRVRRLFDSTVWGGAGENYVGVVAHRWNRTVETFLRYRGRVELVRYEDFVEDKVGYINRLARTVGQVPTRDISHIVDTQFQPRGSEIAPAEFFGENLKRIDQVCGDLMPQVGYTPAGHGPTSGASLGR